MTTFIQPSPLTLLLDGSPFNFQPHNRGNQRFIIRRRWRCLASEQPHRQQRPQPSKSAQQPKRRNKKSLTDSERGIDPVGFLTKHGITNKAFAQFLRERWFNLDWKKWRKKGSQNFHFVVTENRKTKRSSKFWTKKVIRWTKLQVFELIYLHF